MNNQKLSQESRTSWKAIFGLVILTVIIIGVIVGYIWRVDIEILSILFLKIGVAEKPDKTADWKTYKKEKISFRYPDDVWQIKDKDFTDSPSDKTDVYFINEKIDSCEVWLGISVLDEMCRTHVLAIGECGSDEDIEIECELPKSEEIKEIELNDEISAERTIWTMHSEERIEAWYDIYDQESNNIYCAVLFGFSSDWEECLDDFEQILSTFRFLE